MRPTFPHLAVRASDLEISVPAHSSPKWLDDVDVRNTGAGVLNWTATVTYLSGSGWLDTSPASGVGYGSIRLVAHPESLESGTYRATFTVDAGPLAGSRSLPVTLVVTAAVPPPPTVTRVSNAASLLAGNGCVHVDRDSGDEPGFHDSRLGPVRHPGESTPHPARRGLGEHQRQARLRLLRQSDAGQRAGSRRRRRGNRAGRGSDPAGKKQFGHRGHGEAVSRVLHAQCGRREVRCSRPRRRNVCWQAESQRGPGDAAGQAGGRHPAFRCRLRTNQSARARRAGLPAGLPSGHQSLGPNRWCSGDRRPGPDWFPRDCTS